MAAAPAAPAFPSSIRLCKAFRDIIVQARPASGCAIPNKPNPDPIIGMDCSRDGSVILTYSKHQLSIYDVIAGVLRRKILVKDEITDAKLKPTDPSFAFLLLKTPGRGVLEEEDFDSSSSELEREVLDQEREDLTDPVRRASSAHADTVRLFDLFADTLVFDLTLNPESKEEIKFISLHPNQDLFLLGTTVDFSMWDYAGYFRKRGDKNGRTTNTTGGETRLVRKSAPPEGETLLIKCLGKGDLFGDIVAGSFDTQGMIFGLCTGKASVHLYDTKSFVKGSFLELPLPEP